MLFGGAIPRMETMSTQRFGSVRSVAGALALGAVIFVGCSESADETANPQTFAETQDVEDSTATSTADAAVDSGSQISFASDVQPILEANCVSCHSGTGPGTTHLFMETAEEISNVAEFAAFRVEEGQMPPWPLSGLQEISYQYDLSMSDEDRQVLIDWAAEGGELDVDGTTELVATNQTFPPIEEDVVLYPEGSYTGSGELRDDYRCRVLETGADEDQWVTSLEVRPDETRVLHHGVVFLATADDRAIAQELSAEDELPGWQCQTIPQLSDGFANQVAAWAPGTGPITLPEGTGLRAEADDFFIIQWHYHYDGEPLPDNSGLAVQYATDEEVAAAGGTLEELRTNILLGPAEIPCASFESGPGCDRDVALERVAREFGFQSTLIPALVNAQCGVTPEDFAHFTDGVASSSCDIEMRNGELVSIWPHMHELGTNYRLTLNPDTPDEQILIDIDQWNFDWQLGYYPEERIPVNAGDTLRLECGWDRALWPADEESRYIVWAEGTADEMCYTGILSAG